MIYEVTQSEKKHVEHQGYYGKLAPYNVCPPGWEPLTAEEFAYQQCLRTPAFIEFRQLRLNKDGTAPPLDEFNRQLQSVQLFWTDRWSGYAMAYSWHKKEVYFYKFGFTDEQITELTKEGLPAIVSDDNWGMDEGTSIPRRGIRDYNRTIEFERELTPDELASAKEWVGLVKCPGWTGVTVRHREGTTSYTFRTTYDSSD